MDFKKFILVCGMLVLFSACSFNVGSLNSTSINISDISNPSSTVSTSNKPTTNKPTTTTNKPTTTTIIPTTQKPSTTIPTGEKSNQLNIFFINDNHGRFVDESSNGFARIATSLKNATNSYGEHIKIANGDIFQGTYISNSYYGKPLVEGLNYLKFDAFVIGNHEFDWGLDKIAAYKDGNLANGEADFPFLGANIVYKSTNKNPEWIDPYLITYSNNRKVGIVGLIGKHENSINQAMLIDYSFLDPVSTAKTYIKQLRDEHKCDSVIVAIHDYDTDSKNITEQFGKLTNNETVDALLCAHTHQQINKKYTRTDNTSMPIVQNGGNSNNSSSLRLTYNQNNVVTSYSVYQYKISSMTPDEEIHNALIAYYEELNNQAKNRILGTTSKYLNDDALGDIATTAMEEKYNADLAVMNTGGVRSTIPAGNISYQQVYECFPFDNYIYTFTFTGSEVKAFVNKAGTFMYYNPSFNSSNISNNKTYKVAVIDYVFNSTYYTSYFANVNYEENEILRDVVVEYFENNY